MQSRLTGLERGLVSSADFATTLASVYRQPRPACAACSDSAPGVRTIDTAPTDTGTRIVASVTVSPGAVPLAVGGTQELVAIVRDATGTTLTGRSVAWTSSATNVTAVSPTGLVTGVGHGTATITATSDGVSGSVSSTVPGAVATFAYVASGGRRRVRFDCLRRGPSAGGAMKFGPARGWHPGFSYSPVRRRRRRTRVCQSHRRLLSHVRSDGERSGVYRRGYDLNGQLGDGATTDRSLPTPGRRRAPSSPVLPRATTTRAG